MLTREIAQALLRPALPSAVVERLTPRSGGENSAVYEVHTASPARRLIIKVYSEELHWKLRKEVHVYGLLGGGLPLPRIVHVDESRRLLDRNVLVLTLLDGVPLATVAAELEPAELSRVYRRLGEILATMHRITQPGFGYIGTELLDPVPTNAEYMAARFTRKLTEFTELGGDAAIRAAVERHVAGHAGAFTACRSPVLCHNDFHEGNILVAPGAAGWEVTGVIDLENALAADPVLDLAKTDYYAVRGDETKLAALLAGYGTPPPGYPETLALYRIYHALELWDWFATTGRPEHLAGLAADLRRFTA